MSDLIKSETLQKDKALIYKTRKANLKINLILEAAQKV